MRLSNLVCMVVGLRGLVLGVVSALICAVLGCSFLPNFQYSYQTGLLKAEQLEREGFPAEALAMYERTLPRIPAHSRQELAVALMRAGDCQSGLGKLNEAFANYQKAAEVDPENLDARLHLAEFYVAAGVPNRAMEHLNFVLSRRPEDAAALGIMGSIEAAAGHYDHAKELLERSVANDPQRPIVAVALAEIYNREDNVPQARAVLLKAAAASAEVKKSAVAWLGLGRLEEQEGVVLSAELAYRSAVSADDSVTTNLRLAQFLERSARVDDAEKVLKHVDSLRPSEPSALADFQLIAGRPADALKSYETNGANAGLNASRLIEAQMQAERGAKTAPDAKTLLAKYRDVLDGTVGAVLDSEAALAEGDLARAEVHAINAVTRGPRSATAHYIRGVIFNYQHKVAEAKAEWNSALDAEPEYVPAQLALARQNLQEQDLLTAEEHASSVVRDEPANLDALCLYARVLMAQGRTASARGIARRALSVNGKSAEVRVVMGRIELQAHRYGPAFMEFQRALLLNSQSVEAMDGLLDVYRHGVITLAALNKMERVAAAPPVSVPLLEITGRLYADRRLNKDAVRVLKRVIEIDPARHTAALALAEAHYALGDEKSASELMMSGSTIVSPGFLKLRAAEAQERGDSESAIQDYESAVNSGDASGVVANNLAWAYAQRGVKLDRALELATSAVERNPKNPAVLDTLGVVQLKRRNYSEAVEALQKASLLMDSPEWKLQRAEVYRHLAEAYLGAGLSIRAADAMEKTGK